MTIAIIYLPTCLGIAETSPGESCTDFCASKGLICYNNFNSTNLTELLINSGINCGMNSRPHYSEDYDPSVVMGDCAGFENVENYDCDAVPLDSVTSRICNCLSAGTIFSIIASSIGQCDLFCNLFPLTLCLAVSTAKILLVCH